MRVYRDTNGYSLPVEHTDVILEYLKNNGALEPINISSIMKAYRHDPDLRTSEEVYAIEYTASNTTNLQHISISTNYIKAVIRNKKINKIIDG